MPVVVLQTKWYHKLCFSMTAKPEIEKAIEKTSSSEEESGFRSFSNVASQTLQIVNQVNGLQRTWFAKRVKPNRVVRLGVTQQNWIGWNVTFNNNSFHYMFALPDLDNPGSFLFAYADTNDNRVKLTQGAAPQQIVVQNGLDPRLFLNFELPQTQNNVLQHVASGQYLSFDSDDRLILTPMAEDAATFSIEFQ